MDPKENTTAATLVDIGGKIETLRQDKEKLDATLAGMPTKEELETANAKLAEQESTIVTLKDDIKNISGRIDASGKFEVEDKFSGLAGFGRAVRYALLAKSGDLSSEQKTEYTNYRQTLTGQVEGIDSKGGFLVTPEVEAGIRELQERMNPFMAGVDRRTISSDRYKIRAVKSTDQGLGMAAGVLAYFVAEAGTITRTDMDFEEIAFDLEKVAALTSSSAELLEDSDINITSQLMKAMATASNQRIMKAITAGTGVGQHQGIIGATSTITVAKEAAQTADTIVYENVIKMWQRLLPQFKSDAVWLMTPDGMQQLYNMDFPGDSSSVWLPGNNIAGAPFGTIMGRPVVENVWNETLGDLGDIILVSPSAYLLVEGATRVDTSDDLYFTTDQTAIRMVSRSGGGIWLPRALGLPNNAAFTQSGSVVLAERA